MQQLNKYYMQEVLYDLLAQLSYYYEGSKSNKKQVIEFIKILPFFFFDHYNQSNLYDIINRKNIESYIDNDETMKELCYDIYKEYSIKYKIDYVDYDEFYSNMLNRLNRTNIEYKQMLKDSFYNYLFFIVILSIIYLYYLFLKNEK
jgi:hypothetical protein